MKKNAIFTLITICLLACTQSAHEGVHITGEIKGLGTDTLYLYGMDEVRDWIDTIYVENNRFTYQTDVDTITPAYLLIQHQIEYPVFLNKGNKIKIKGDLTQSKKLHISGNPYNEEFTYFQQVLDTLNQPTPERMEQEAEKFITQHPASFVSLYLLDKYFVQKENPDLKQIKKLTEGLSGILQDKIYTEQLNDDVTQSEKTLVGKYAPYFNLPNKEGKKITRSSEKLRKKILLIHFWASWSDSIRHQESMQEMKALYQKYKKNKYISLLGISLDLNKEEWLHTIQKDTLQWEQLCDFEGLNAEVAKQYAIKRIPSTILLSPSGKVLAKDLSGEELEKKIEEAVKEEQEQEKRNKR